jgi:MscS family membrane protein
MRACRSMLIVMCALTLVSAVPRAQPLGLPAPAAPAEPSQPEQPRDPLGRDTPRDTVIGFLAASRRGAENIARQYLDTSLGDADAAVLSHQLYVVLDARLPPRVMKISNAPSGSKSDPSKPDQEVVGTIESAGGDVEVILERVTRPNGAPVWLFSKATLESVPALYGEVTLGFGEGNVPRFLTRTRVLGIRVFEWIAVLLGLPLIYLLTILLNWVLRPVIRALWRRVARQSDLFDRDVLPGPVRLLILVVAIRWLLSALPLPLLVRQFWSNLATVLTVVGVVWLLYFLSAETERFVRRRFPRANTAAAATLLRMLRRLADLLVIFSGVLILLRHYGIDPTPALAGLGVGGIAIALAAQKTLENVIAGASLIFDQAVRVGDFLKMGDVQGTVDKVGLRSTRIRTLDRTIVSVPNSQIANVSLETLSERDKFWFHPVVGLRYETTTSQLRAVVDGIRRLLDEHSSVEHESVRVRFLRLGAFSLDVDVFAYVIARDWNHFLEIQEQFLFAITSIVEKAGTEIAFPSQTMYLTNTSGALTPPQPSAR